MANKMFSDYDKRQRFSLRKYSVGLASVLLGTLVMWTQTVQADEQANPVQLVASQVENVTDSLSEPIKNPENAEQASSTERSSSLSTADLSSSANKESEDSTSATTATVASEVTNSSATQPARFEVRSMGEELEKTTEKDVVNYSLRSADPSQQEDDNAQEENSKRIEYFKQLKEAKLERIEIPYGLTRIDSEAFKDAKHIKEVVIPETVVEIGNNAFSGTSLKEVNLPKGLKYLGDSAFSDIDTLEKAFVPSTLELGGYSNYWYYSNGSRAFANNKNLTEIEFEPGLTFIPAGIAANTALTKVTIPEGVETIHDSAFSGSNQITAVSLPSTLKYIDNSAFYGTSLSSVDLPRGLESIGSSAFYSNPLTQLILPEGLDTVDHSAFSKTLLKEITIPSSVKTISTAFSENDYLKKVTIQGDLDLTHSDSSFYLSPITDVTISDGVTKLPAYLFNNQTGIKTITLPNSIKEIGAYAFTNTGLTNLVLPEGVTTIGHSTFGSMEKLTSVKIPASLESANGAFYGSSNLEHVMFATGTKKIADGLLSGTSFTSFVVPEGIEEIGKNAFANNQSLETVTLPSTLTKMGDGVFANTSLKTIIFPKNMTKIPKGILASTAVERVVIPEGVEEIESGAFSNNSYLKEVILPSTLKKIGDSAFYNTAIESITLPARLSEIGASAFSNTKLTSISLPDTVEKLGGYAFSSSPIETVRLSNSLTEIPNNAFAGTKLKQVSIPSRVEKIGDHAFSGIGELTSVTFSTGLKEIGHAAFEETSLTDVVLPQGLEKIGGRVFSTSTLKTIFIPKSLKEAGTYSWYDWGAFHGATALERVTFEAGTDRIADNLFKGASIETLPLSETVREIASGAFAYSSLKQIQLPAGLEVIGDSAFYQTHLTSVVLPSQLKKIGEGAFSSTLLTNITVPNSVNDIGSEAFANTADLTSAHLSEKLTEISDRLFNNSGLKEILLPSNITRIGVSAFANTKLKEITIPSKVVTINDSAFSHSSLESLNLTDGLQTIGEGAFTGTKLGELVLPDTVERLESSAFNNAGITKLTLSKNLQDAGQGSPWWSRGHVFANNPELKEVHIPKALAYGWRMFDGNKQLSKISFEDGRTEIPSGLFANTGIQTLELPSTIELIGSHAFEDNTQLTEWQPHEGLKEIHLEAFENSGLHRLVLPESLSSLGERAFANNSNLNELSLNKTLEMIPIEAFSGARLDHLTVPANIKTIGDYAFANNVTMRELTLENGLDRIEEGAFSGNNLSTLKFPSSLTHLGASAFADNHNLSTVYISSTLAENDYYGYPQNSRSPFKHVNPNNVDTANLFVTFENGVTHVPKGLFVDANQLIYVKIPDGVTSIGDYAFHGTSLGANFDRKIPINDMALDPDNLLTVTLPDSVQTLGESSFGNIKTLTNINIPKDLVEADMAFRGSRNLKRLRTEIPGARIPDGIMQETGVTTFIVPNDVTEVGKYAFLGNKTVEASDSQSEHTGLDNVVFSPGLTKIDTRAFEKTSLTFVDVPNGVTEINDGAFRFNDQLSSVKLPKELKHLSGYLFEGNQLMESLIVPPKVESVDVNAFVNMPNLKTVYLPSSVSRIDDNLIINPEVEFLVEAGSYAQGYMQANNLKHKIVNTGTYDRFYDGIVIADKTNFVTSSQALKQSGYLALDLTYALDTAGRSITDKEIRVTLPKGMVSFVDKKDVDRTNPRTSQTEKSSNLKREVVGNVLHLYNISDSEKIRLYIKTDNQDLVRLNIAAQVIYKEHGTQKSELLGTISEDMPFLTITTPSTISEKKVTVSGRTVPNAKVRFEMVNPVTTGGVSYIRGTENLYPDLVNVETIANSDGTYRTELPIDFVNARRIDFTNGGTFQIKAIAQIDGIKLEKDSETITYHDDAPRLISFKMTHNGRTIDLTDGQPNEAIVFRPGQEFEFKVRLTNDDGTVSVKVRTQRGYDKKEVELKKDETGSLYQFKGYFDNSQRDFIPDKFEVLVSKRIIKDADGDGLLDPDKLSNEDKKVLQTSGKYKDFIDKDDKSWDVSPRDLAMFSVLTYAGQADKLYDTNPKLKELFSKKLKERTFDDIDGLKGKLDGLDITCSDTRLFDNWTVLGQLHQSYQKFYDIQYYGDNGLKNETIREEQHQDYKNLLFYKINNIWDFRSTVTWFIDNAKKNLVIAFRGTDEGIEGTDAILGPRSELKHDYQISKGKDKAKDKAREQIRQILQKWLPDDLINTSLLKNIYITGHSLGGYQAYHATDEVLKSDDLAEFRDKLRGTVVFNSPGVHHSQTDVIERLKEAYKNKKNILLYYIDSENSVNRSIVIGEVLSNGNKNTKHIDWQPLKIKYHNEKTYRFFPLLYAHDMDSFFYHLDTGYRTSKNKFLNAEPYPQISPNEVRNYTLIPHEHVTYVIDPSGTVRNSVTAKPVVGATASVYYRNESGEEVLWRAGDYSQINPMLTTINGEYVWDVPEGWWKVKISKDGYNSQESDWLPVPPPQTEINFTLQPKTYQLTFDLAGGIASAALPLTYQTDVEVALPALTKEGYTFKGWFIGDDMDGQVYSNTLFSTVGDKRLVAKWEEIKVVTQEVRQERRPLPTAEVAYLDDVNLPVGQTREELGSDGYILVEITETYENGVLVSSSERELSRVEATPRKVYRGTKPTVTVSDVRTRQERRPLLTAEIVYLDDVNLPVGQTRDELGADGYILVEITETYENGVLVSSSERELSRVEATPRKVYRGTKPTPTVSDVRTRQERRPLPTADVLYLDDANLPVGQTRDELGADGYILVEITETYENGVLVSSSERELSRIKAEPRKIYRGTKRTEVVSEGEIIELTMAKPPTRTVMISSVQLQSPIEVVSTSEKVMSSQATQSELPRTSDSHAYWLASAGLTLAGMGLVGLKKKASQDEIN